MLFCLIICFRINTHILLEGIEIFIAGKALTGIAFYQARKQRRSTAAADSAAVQKGKELHIFFRHSILPEEILCLFSIIKAAHIAVVVQEKFHTGIDRDAAGKRLPYPCSAPPFFAASRANISFS